MPLRDIPGFEGRYAITHAGRVWSHARPGRWHAGFIQLHEDKDGYLLAFLADRGRVLTRRIARLVLATYVSEPKEGQEANHKDGNKKNNRLGNLEWLSSLENTHHACDTGLVRGRLARVVEIGGIEKPLADWCREYQAPYFRTHARIFRLGWDARRALIEDSARSHQ